MELVPGIYETLITERLQAVLDDLAASGLLASEMEVDKVEQASVLADHVAHVVEQLLTTIPDADRVAVTNRLLAAVLTEAVKHLELVDTVEPGPKQLAEIRQAGLRAVPLQRPRIPLRDSDLLINARGEPGLVAEPIRVGPGRR